MLISVEYGSVVPLRFVNKYQAEDIYSIPLGIYWITKEWVSKAAESHECIIIFAPHLHAVGVFPSIRRTPCHTIRRFSEANAARGNAEYHEGHHGDTMPPKRKTKKHHCAIELGYLDEPHHVSMIGSNEETPLLEIAG
jgi:hypothetical protein